MTRRKVSGEFKIDVVRLVPGVAIDELVRRHALKAHQLSA